MAEHLHAHHHTLTPRAPAPPRPTRYHKTVKLDPDLGDAWAAYYRFELKHGTAEQAEAVVKYCEQAEPRHGEVWQRVAKRVENWKKTTREILVLAAAELADIV
jgi:pre-mRNA-processing factor 6